MSVMDIASRQMASRPDKRLSAIELSVGEYAGVEIDTFSTAIQTVIKSSQWPDAVAEINVTPSMARCLMCGKSFHPASQIPECPQCHSSACGIVSGREFKVIAIRML